MKEYVNKFLALKQSYKAALSIVILSLLWISSGIFHETDTTSKNDEKTSVQKVRTRTIYTEEIKASISVHGVTKANKSVNIRAETSGKVKNIGIEKGSHISMGETIVKLANNERMERLKEAQSLLSQRNLEFNAAKKLSQKGFNSKTKLAQATAARDSALTVLKIAKLDVQNANIEAPFDGILANRTVEIGDYVNKGDVIASIINLNPIKIIASLPETVASNIKKGDTGTAVLITGKKIDGIVSYISPSAIPQTRTYEIELIAENPDGSILDGVTLELQLHYDTIKTMKISPAVLTLNEIGQVGVKTVDEDDIVKFHTIEIIKQTNEGMWVSGMPDKATLITTGQEFVKVGAKVITVDEETVKKAILENSPKNSTGDK